MIMLSIFIQSTIKTIDSFSKRIVFFLLIILHLVLVLLVISIVCHTLKAVSVKAVIARANTSTVTRAWKDWFPRLLLLVLVKLSILLLFFLLFFLQLSLIVSLVVNLFKTREPLLRCDTPFTLQQVYQDAVRSLLDTLPCKSSFLSQTAFVAQVSLITEVIDTVQKLAPLTVHTVALLLVLAAQLGLVVRGKVLLWH